LSEKAPSPGMHQAAQRSRQAAAYASTLIRLFLAMPFVEFDRRHFLKCRE
jgi:hypothetical protein